VSLLWRVFAVNAAVLVVATVALAVSPATVSFPLALTEAIVLTVGLFVSIVVNFLLLRWATRPLERLTHLMRRVDPLRPGSRLPVDEGTPELVKLGVAFNDMLARLELERRENARRALAAQESERRRLSRELHDEVGQALTGVLLELESATGESSSPHVTEAREGVRASLEAVRAIARHLRPVALDDLGLAAALRGLAVQVARSARFEVERRVESPLPKLSDEEELVVYRIAQEALTNAARHAHAEQVELRLGWRAGALELLVRDDGRGFDPARTAEGAGIRGMRERAVLVGAELWLEASPRWGTEVRLRLAGPA
jgi:two-component system, NarL family, sensor histidine kinase UhpB